MTFENSVGKGEMTLNEQFLLFPHCFLSMLENLLPFSSNLKLSYANSFSLEVNKICCLGKGYRICLDRKTADFLPVLHFNSLPTIPILNDPEKEAILKYYGKRRKCW